MAHWSTLNSYFTVVKSILTKITVSIGPSFKDSCTAHAIPACQQLCYHAQVSYWSFLLHCLALFLLQAASSAKQALSQLQHRASWDSTITALHGLLCAVFLPQLGASAPVSVSPDMGGSSSLLGSPRGSWVQQTQREGGTRFFLSSCAGRSSTDKCDSQGCLAPNKLWRMSLLWHLSRP